MNDKDDTELIAVYVQVMAMLRERNLTHQAGREWTRYLHEINQRW